jgi:benzoyl-CoA 2,3-epoxidase subunit B
MLKLTNFDDWIDYFYGWQKDIGLDAPEFRQYKFEAKYGQLPHNEIEFGDYKGQLRWKTVMHIPDQRVRDAALNLIVYQGDTEFASVEQQRHLFETAPSRYDYLSLVRVMTEEMRHGWQMSHLLVTQFGRSGKIEAQKLLERRAFSDDRLLGAFNEIVGDWLDFYTYTHFVDRDGKFQLTMLS